MWIRVEGLEWRGKWMGQPSLQIDARPHDPRHLSRPALTGTAHDVGFRV